MRIYPSERNTTTDERLLAAAKEDNEDMLVEIFDSPGSFDINYQDGSVHHAQQDSYSLSHFDLQGSAIQVLRSHPSSSSSSQLNIEPFTRTSPALRVRHSLV